MNGLEISRVLLIWHIFGKLFSISLSLKLGSVSFFSLLLLLLDGKLKSERWCCAQKCECRCSVERRYFEVNMIIDFIHSPSLNTFSSVVSIFTSQQLWEIFSSVVFLSLNERRRKKRERKTSNITTAPLAALKRALFSSKLHTVHTGKCLSCLRLLQPSTSISICFTRSR